MIPFKVQPPIWTKSEEEIHREMYGEVVDVFRDPIGSTGDQWFTVQGENYPSVQQKEPGQFSYIDLLNLAVGYLESRSRDPDIQRLDATLFLLPLNRDRMKTIGNKIIHMDVSDVEADEALRRPIYTDGDVHDLAEQVHLNSLFYRIPFHDFQCHVGISITERIKDSMRTFIIDRHWINSPDRGKDEPGKAPNYPEEFSTNRPGFLDVNRRHHVEFRPSDSGSDRAVISGYFK